MYKDDALTRYTSAAAQKIMMLIEAQPQGVRSSAVQGALDAIRPGLYLKVDRLAGAIAAGGISTLMAYQEAIRLSLADVFMDAVKALARAKATGKLDDAAMEAQRMFYGDPHITALGDSGDGLGSAARDAANFGLNVIRAAACSDEVRDLITGAITSEGARSAAGAGLSVAKSIAACNKLPGATPPPGPAAPPPPATTPEAKDNTTTYVLAGAAVLGLGAIMFFALRK